jgi:hypothetical protein
MRMGGVYIGMAFGEAWSIFVHTPRVGRVIHSVFEHREGHQMPSFLQLEALHTRKR